MKIVRVIALLLLFGCGNQGVHVEVVELDKDLIFETFGEESISFWNDESCTIYIRPENQYRCKAEWDWVIGHEFGYHCYQKRKHGTNPDLLDEIRRPPFICDFTGEEWGKFVEWKTQQERGNNGD